MTNLRIASASSIALSLMLYSGNALGCSDLKCPFTGQPPNYECPPKLTSASGSAANEATVEIIGISAGAQSGESCQVTVVGLTDLVSVAQVNILDYDTRLPIKGFEGFKANKRVAAAFSKGLDAKEQSISGYGSAQIKPQSFSSNVSSTIYPGKTVIIEIKYRTDSRLKATTSESIANMLLGYSSVITGHLSKDGLPDGHTSWQRITELERETVKRKK